MKKQVKKFSSLADLNALKQQLQEKEMQEIIRRKNPARIDPRRVLTWEDL